MSTTDNHQNVEWLEAASDAQATRLAVNATKPDLDHRPHTVTVCNEILEGHWEAPPGWLSHPRCSVEPAFFADTPDSVLIILDNQLFIRGLRLRGLSMSAERHRLIGLNLRTIAALVATEALPNILELAMARGNREVQHAPLGQRFCKFALIMSEDLEGVDGVAVVVEPR